MSPSIHEFTRPSVRQLDLLRGGEMVQREVAERVQKANGTIWMFVHQNYTRQRNDFMSIDPYTPPEEYKRRRDSLTSYVIPHGKIPLVFLEEQEKLGELNRYLEQSQEGTVFVVPTKKNSPYPVGFGVCSWGPIPDMLHQAGVETVILGGAILRLQPANDNSWSTVQIGMEQYQSRIGLEKIQEYATQLHKTLGREPLAYQWTTKNTIPQDCVGGTAIDLLREGFDVVISYPHTALQK